MPRAIPMNPRKSATQERSRATVEALLDATARILVREGYERASTNRIAAVAGVSVGSLYQYFPNKESIVAALIARHNREIVDLLRDAMAAVAALDLEAAMRELIAAMVDAHRVDPHLHRIFDEQIPRKGQLEEIEAINREVFALVRAYLAERRDEIEVTDLDTATFICVTTVETLTHEAVLRHPDTIDPAALVDEVTRLVVGYLRPARGLAEKFTQRVDSRAASSS
ncbi:MAG TPA: TetR/AcrR family transcriptional regulator [Sphingomonas sp.]|nr:TetR/AcrR family transcriptional regulator [Sphingomonas sp.]